MHRFVVRCVLLVVALLTLAACGTDKVALQGQVLDAYTNQPVPGAVLQIGDKNGITTDADGKYTIADWSAEDTLQAQAAGYDVASINLGEKPELQAASPQASSSVTVDLALRPNTLSGTITDALTGQPVANAVVKVSDALSATTGPDGTYRLEGVPETAQVSVSAPNYSVVQAPVSRTNTFATQLRPDVLRGTITNTYSGEPVAGLTVRAGDVIATTGPDGRYELRGLPANAEISIEGDGFDTVRLAQPNTTTYDAQARPNSVTGTVVNDTTGSPLPQVELVAVPALGKPSVARTRTDDQGKYRMPGVPEGSTIMALLPGYLRAETVVEQGQMAGELRLKPFESKAIYMSAALASYGGMDTVNRYFDLIERTELNTLILDVKSDRVGDVGRVYYDSQVPQVIRAGTVSDRMPIKEILAEAKRRGIYMVARVQMFSHDDALIEAHPDWYAQKNGKPYRANDGLAWLDPYDDRVWDYNIALSVEAAQLGFDEIQFDYVRFPSDGNLEGIKFKGPYSAKGMPEKYEAIARGCERAHVAINDAGAFFGIDVFGYAAWKPSGGIGQNMSLLGPHIDYVYPMVYPSHFAYNELGLGNPDEHPYEMVDHSMKLLSEQLGDQSDRVKVRPWLQDFTARWIKNYVTYGPDQVRAQIDASEDNRDNGTNGWALWNSANKYTEGALEPDS